MVVSTTEKVTPPEFSKTVFECVFLSRSQFFSVPLSPARCAWLHPNVAVMLEHLHRDVAGNVQDRLIARAALGRLQCVTVVAPPAFYAHVRANVGPRSS